MTHQISRTGCRSARVVFCVAAMIFTIGASADEKKLTFTFLPGASREISHATSASRDTALIAYQVEPQVAVTTGGDFAFFGFAFRGMSLRLGLFGMFELETADPNPVAFLSVPSGPYLWRGLLGYSIAYSLDRFASKLLGPRGAMELALAYRHESEHYTGGGDLDVSRFEGVQHIGDFILFDIAGKKSIAKIAVVEVRVQNKFFLPYGTGRAYTYGPGGDLSCRFPVTKSTHPFISLFGEYLFGATKGSGSNRQIIQDNFLIRGLLGVNLPGKAADLQLYFSWSYGHGKGLLAYEKNANVGWGMRVVLFKNRPIHPKRDAQGASATPSPRLGTRGQLKP